MRLISARAQTEPAAIEDPGGIGLLVAAIVAAVATLFVGPGSGAGPAALAVLAWLVLILVACWVAVVTDDVSIGDRTGAVVLASMLAGGFIATADSPWAMAFPAVAMIDALGRRRSKPRLLAVATFLGTVLYVLVGGDLG